MHHAPLLALAPPPLRRLAGVETMVRVPPAHRIADWNFASVRLRDGDDGKACA
ncbi:MULTISPECIES: hypothetical protein [Ramlibacter]|uniref:Uncharacterized protein n=1 Tax=Ramlibacter pinisoli TaxID=2682844 RepID=A0A6N8J0T3_9BURK|nr:MULTISPECIES: hypothetical protein [Ramlibacter]MBA2961930.1 hypothetical protein [Ramlibacter sp. CGMCC 1.13660]MVQ31873.1 hypothetical protein [Ramlibacter pinisoli]